MKILFFGQLREILGQSELALENPPTSVLLLRQLLAQRGQLWQQYLLSDMALVAVNQTLTDDHQALLPSDEVAFFPPVTGG